jgi:hypothetical protein
MLHLKFITNWFVPAKFGAVTYGPLIFIRPSRANDVGIYKHELVHVEQFWRNPFFGLSYLFSKEARLWYELEAYREQLKWYDDDRSTTFARFMATKYKLDITEQQALNLLKS